MIKNKRAALLGLVILFLLVVLLYSYTVVLYRKIQALSVVPRAQHNI